MSEDLATATWDGPFAGGAGTLFAGSAAFEAPLAASKAREVPPATNPDELLAAAHAACFSMALAHRLARLGLGPPALRTAARVTTGRAGDPYAVVAVHLATQASAPAGLDLARFRAAAADAATNCPMSRALKGNVAVTVEATLAPELGERP